MSWDTFKSANLACVQRWFTYLRCVFTYLQLRSIQHIASSHTWGVFPCLPSLPTPHSFQLTFDHIHVYVLRYNQRLYDNQHSWRLCNTISALVAANWSHFVFPLGCPGTRLKSANLACAQRWFTYLRCVFTYFQLRSIQHIAPSHTWSVFSHICRHFPLLILSSSHLITYTCTCCFIIKGFYDNQHSWRLCNTISVLVAANWSHFVFPLGCHGTRLKVPTWHVHNVDLFSMNSSICVHCIHARSASTPRRCIQRAHSTTPDAASLSEARWRDEQFEFSTGGGRTWVGHMGRLGVFTYLPSLSTPQSIQRAFDHIHVLLYNQRPEDGGSIHGDCATRYQHWWLLIDVISFSYWDVMGHF